MPAASAIARSSSRQLCPHPAKASFSASAKWASMTSRFAGFGVEHIAITRDSEPIIAHAQGQTSEVPVMAVKPVDTLGAGDIFHGAFCHYILEYDFLLSLERAGEVASLSCTSLGTRAWIEQEKFL